MTTKRVRRAMSIAMLAFIGVVMGLTTLAVLARLA